MDVSVPKEPLRESYVNAVCTEPVVDITVRQALEIVADKYPDHPSFIFSHSDQELTNARLLKKADEYAKAFLALGLEKGDRVLEAGLSDEEWVAVIFGAWTVGLIVQHVSLFEPVDVNIEQLVNKSGAKMLLIGDGRPGTNYIGPLLRVAPEMATSKESNLHITRLPTLKYVFTHQVTIDVRGSRRLKELATIGADISDASLRKAIDCVDISDIAVILTSTGTTGDPKLVCQSHRCLSNGLVSMAKRQNPNNEDMLVCQMSPLYDDLICLIFALPCIILPAMGCFNYTMVYTNDLTDSAEKVFYMVETAARYKCNHIEWYPYVWSAVVEQGLLDKYDLSSVHGALVGGMKVDEASMESFNRLIKDVLNIYAATEAEPISLQFITDSLEIKKSTIGFPVRHTEVKLVDENDDIVAIGKEGEICVRGPTVFIGYWGDDELTRKVKDEHGWYHTGDIGKMLPYGHLKFVGRKADAMRYKKWLDVVYPGPIEEHAQTHPKVAAAALVGLHRELVGDTLCLFVVAKENEKLTKEEMVNHFEAGMTELYHPDHYIFVDDIPTIGIRRKIPRRILKEVAEKTLKDYVGKDDNYEL